MLWWVVRMVRYNDVSGSWFSIYCKMCIRDSSRLAVVDRDTSFLSAQELADTLLIFVQQSQKLHFDVEVRELDAHRCLPRSSKILALNPFLDESGILRVGAVSYTHLDVYKRQR